MTRDFAALKDENFVSLTTFKKSGEGVAAPVWIVADGQQLLVWTPADSWKVKRIRRDPRVALVPCGRTGKIHTTAAPVDATAEVVEDPSVVAYAVEALKRKYGFEFHLITLIERIAARGAKKPRVVVRISAPAGG